MAQYSMSASKDQIRSRNRQTSIFAVDKPRSVAANTVRRYRSKWIVIALACSFIQGG